MKKVLIPTKLDPVARNLLSDHGNYLAVQEEGVDLLELAASHADTYALIVRSEKVTQEVIDAFPELRIVVRAGAGYNTIDIQYARKRGIDVMNTPGANSNAVAEEVIALMLADSRHLIPADASCRAGKWEKSKFMGREITGKTLGVVGLGHIGQLAVKRLAGFEMEVVGYDPFINADRAASLGVRLVSLQEVFELSDFITLHIPENDETRGIINKELMSGMKDGAAIINCARSGVINEDDLRAIKPEKNLRFLNDVYAKDAAGDKSVADIADIMLPHLGASSREANENAARMAANIIMDFDDKGITSYIVNRDIPEGLDEAYGDLAFTLCALARGLHGGDTRLKTLETSVYGDLKKYEQWLVVPMVCAMNPDFDRSLDHQAALDQLKRRGIEVIHRDVDNLKGYGDSITLDLTIEDEKGGLSTFSVRGTVTEGHLMISRIDDFDKLYFDPKGHTLIFSFEDRPGVLGQIAAAVAEAGMNIDDVRNPHSACGKESIAILKVNTCAPAELVESIKEKIGAHYGACVHIS